MTPFARDPERDIFAEANRRYGRTYRNIGLCILAIGLVITFVGLLLTG